MNQYVESEKIELKAKYTDAICKEIVAFLNADGGQIIIGVDDNGNVIGYTEEKLKIEDVNNINLEVLEEIKEDIITLSYSGFKIEDIFYNYTTSNNFKFYDLTSFGYIKSTKKELYDMYYKKNIMTINTFLVGFLMYDAYRHDSKYEIKKTYKATEFINENLGNEYYGDYLKNRYKKM